VTTAAGAPAGLVLRAWRGVVWYAKAMAGEDRWEAHVRECASHGHPPGTRRDFERRRAEVAASTPVNRCC